MSDRHLDDAKRLADYDELFQKLASGQPLLPTPHWNKETAFVAFTLSRMRSKVAALERLPLCPDHRDKLNHDTCLKCQIEALTNRLTRTSQT